MLCTQMCTAAHTGTNTAFDSGPPEQRKPRALYPRNTAGREGSEGEVHPLQASLPPAHTGFSASAPRHRD